MKGYKCIYFEISVVEFSKIFLLSRSWLDLGVFLNRPLESSLKKLHFGGKKKVLGACMKAV